jgi:hypothetical protein
LQQFLGDRDIKSAMRYLNIGGKEASPRMRERRSGQRGTIGFWRARVANVRMFPVL